MRSRGFTLIELVVVLTISAILVAAAVPSFMWFISTTRVSNGANNFSAALERARSEAVRRGAVVSICRTLDPNAAGGALACTNAAGGVYPLGDWGAGWVMFEKRMPTAAGVFDWNAGAGDVVLQREQPVGTAGARLIVQSNVAGAAVAYDRFASAASSTPAFSIDYRDPSVVPLSGAARCLVVAAVTGRVRIDRPTPAQMTAGAC